jgi:hypothetical protein
MHHQQDHDRSDESKCLPALLAVLVTFLTSSQVNLTASPCIDSNVNTNQAARKRLVYCRANQFPIRSTASRMSASEPA